MDIDFTPLIDAAKCARSNAYAPYSQFKVGAAILADGKIYSGCNVENASFPAGICAERAAVCALVADGKKTIEAIVITAQKLALPCGMCRQVLSEFNPEMTVFLHSDTEEKIVSLAELFPHPFTFEND